MESAWPELPLEEWQDTHATLHLWLQIVGKVRLALSPWVNHSWHATLYVTPRGLTTSSIPCGARSFRIDLDFIEHALIVQSDDGETRQRPLVAEPVAAFFGGLTGTLASMDIAVKIHGLPNELPDPIPFERDDVHRSYDREYAQRWWRILVQADRVFKQFRARYVGKCSPVHLFWGAADLAVTRFSGRTAPKHPGGIPHLPDWVVQEAYSHEVSSCGFWAGGGPVPYAAFYSYAYPEPAGFASAAVQPADAFYSEPLREFVLPYDVVRTSDRPDDTLLAFLQSTYDAAADLGHWDRAALERQA
jgi:hypothetical protein